MISIEQLLIPVLARVYSLKCVAPGDVRRNKRLRDNYLGFLNCQRTLNSCKKFGAEDSSAVPRDRLPVARSTFAVVVVLRSRAVELSSVLSSCATIVDCTLSPASLELLLCRHIAARESPVTEKALLQISAELSASVSGLREVGDDLLRSFDSHASSAKALDNQAVLTLTSTTVGCAHQAARAPGLRNTHAHVPMI
jgi:hypothetical protein